MYALHLNSLPRILSLLAGGHMKQDIYYASFREELMDNDELSDAEEGVMRGFDQACSLRRKRTVRFAQGA